MQGEGVSDRLMGRVCAWAPAVYLLMSLPVIVFLAFVQPPFTVPDEVSHALRADHLLRGHLMGESLPGRGIGGPVSNPLHQLVFDVVAGYGQAYDQAQESHFRRLHWDDQEIAGAFRSAAYFPAFYLPQMAVIAVGRSLESSVVATLELGRLINGLLCLLIAAAAIRVTPSGRVFLAVLLSLPVPLFLFASFSPDGLLLASAALAVALIARWRYGAAPASWLWPVLPTLLLGAVAATKIVYLPLLFLPLFAAPWSGEGSRLSLETVARRRLYLAQALVLFVVLGWLAFSLSVGVPLRPESDPAAQAAYLTAKPWQILPIALATLENQSGYLLTGAIGLLGWVDIRLPACVIWLALACPVMGLACDSGAEGYRRVSFSLMAVLGVFFACAGAIFLSLYLIWTPVGAQIVEGVQGRYFLPLLPMVLLCLPALRLPSALRLAMASLALIAGPLVWHGATFVAIVEFYYR